MENPLITVIIPVYNVEQYLEKCLDSIINQDYKNLEILLVDDGSPDRCGEICENFARKDSRIRVIHKKNGGLSDARNVAIDIATGEFITFVDSDDYVSDDYISTLYELIKRNNCKISVSGYIRFGEDNKIKESNKLIKEYVFSPAEAIKEMFYQQKFDTSAWAKMYHRSLFADGIRYPVGLLFEDLPTTYKLFQKSDMVAFSNKETYFYLKRFTSIEGSPFSQKKIESTVKIINQLELDFCDARDFKKAVSARILNFSFHILLLMPLDNEDRLLLIDKIKAYRLSVLMDKQAKMKSRITCLVSYFGINNVVKVMYQLNK